MTSFFIFICVVIFLLLFIIYPIHNRKIRKLKLNLSNLEAGEPAVYLDPDFLGSFNNGGSIRCYLLLNDQYKVTIGLFDVVRIEKGNRIQLYMGKKPISPVYSDLEGVYIVKDKTGRKNRLILALSGIIMVVALFYTELMPVEVAVKYNNGYYLLGLGIAGLIYYYIMANLIKNAELHKVDDVTKQL